MKADESIGFSREKLNYNNLELNFWVLISNFSFSPARIDIYGDTIILVHKGLFLFFLSKNLLTIKRNSLKIC